LSKAESAPARRLRAGDVALLIVGIMIGAGIFRVPADIAAATGDGAVMLGLWVVGGGAALAGAFCYAELASRYPGIGGEYHFLRLAFGPRLSAWFVWARLAVIQTGSIAAVAFVAGDQMRILWPDGPPPAFWAIVSVVFVTATALVHLEMTRRLQQILVAVVILSLLAVMVAALWMPAGAVVTDAVPIPAGGGIGMALVFVMLAYGGWNEAAYLSAEVKDGRRSMVVALVGGILLVAVLYLAFNAALLHALGVDGLAANPAPAAVLVQAAFGTAAGAMIALAAIAAALSTINATAITGARAICALGQDMPLIARLGAWDGGRSVPVAALLAQGGVALALTLYAATARDGFAAMVAFGAPVFWLFLSLTAVSLFVLRSKYPDREGFRAPPFLPLVFLAACLFMLWSGVDYARHMWTEGGRAAGLLGIILLLVGLPLAWRAK